MTHAPALPRLPPALVLLLILSLAATFEAFVPLYRSSVGTATPNLPLPRCAGGVRPFFAAAVTGDEADGDGDDDDPTARLRRDAGRLRREAEVLEEEMRERRKEAGVLAPAESTSSRRAEATYTSLTDSAWTVSYRFASDPPPKDGDEWINDAATKPRYYSGKVDVRFRADGYTDILGDEGVTGGIRYTKFWGWDEELSTLDNKTYLLFSADVALPESDPFAMTTNVDKERIYFNARVDKDLRTGRVSLSDGKVAVKRDIKPPGGFWGLFSGQGILAQFQYVGEFVCRPISIDL